MTLKQASAVAGIVVATAYSIIADSPIWLLVVGLAALSGYNLATATAQQRKNRTA
ncbi:MULTISPECIES: hypothetical protein [Corynebacterium]|uniref:hypothetical protein n=1 Tax=Corynebacterium TaxID=1716 RepID=UPI00254DF4D9|nr:MULTISPECIES: hypothetical protein [unclassified Corynebacterium]MDK8452449.1 hypothetical protein [Corynebacterium sp. MSK084]MDK8467548.1 hypothetical protein [Corynebacterium sp. MSK130]MDK8514178.1 hypothetical protein [Corynebacterium sp. MSK123]MDK8547613.1 hypothetical protein [Corynebacterium sp. MSK222]MDK8688193.1 hypothetical protein [Corynebacterium sp. MSK122]